MISLLDSAKSKASAIYELAKIIDNKDLIREVGELVIQLSDMKRDYAALQDENTKLKRQRQQDIDNPLTLSPRGIYFDTNHKLFCAGCYDGPIDRRIPLTYFGTASDGTIYICPVCDKRYYHK